MKLAHIINPVKVSESSDLFTAQPITFESMRVAKAFAKDSVEVELLTTQYEEDRVIIPGDFKILPNLSRSVSDVKKFTKLKKYPFIQDILEQAYQGSDAEYLIFTNADIALMPQFYLAVEQFIDQGHDAFIINRRRVSSKFTRVEQLPLLYSEIGHPHPGFDCFVFQRELYPKFVLGNICVGVPFIGVSLAHNLFCFSEHFKLFTDKHLTIHIGLEVMPKVDQEYYRHNRNEFEKKVLKQLKPHLTRDRLPYAFLPLRKKIVKWSLNPSTFILLNSEIEVKGWWDKIKYLLNDIRFRRLNDE